MEKLWQDVRFGVRMLRRNPGFSLMVALTLALGIGANVAIFSLVNGVLLRPLPFAESDRLVSIWQSGAPKGAFLALREQSRTLEPAVFSFDQGVNLAGDDRPIRLQAATVSVNLFQLLGMNPQMGRTFTAQEEDPAQNRTVVLSHALWRAQFGGDPGIVGRPIVLDGTAHTVAGVMPPGFAFPSPSTQLWLPLELDRASPQSLWGNFYRFVARLNPGVEAGQARAELRALIPRIVKTFPWPMPEGWGKAGDVIPLLRYTVQDVRLKFLLFLGVVALVWLIACANVANLLLGRGAARRREIAVRCALGAGRGRIVRQYLTECLVLSLAAGLLGLAIAQTGLAGLKRLLPAETPRLAEAVIDTRVLWFALGLSFLTALLFGLAPALHAARENLEAALRASAQRLGAGPERRRASAVLVAAEAALCVIVVMGAGLLVRSLWNLSRLETGIDAGRILTARITPGPEVCEPRERCVSYYRRLEERLLALPGVEAAAFSNAVPMTQVMNTVLASEDNPSYTSESPYSCWAFMVTPAYFQTAGIPLLRGSGFTRADGTSAPRVAIVSSRLAERLLPGMDPIGRRVKPSWMNVWWTIVGVVGDVREYSLYPDWAGGVTGDIYFPYAQGISGPPPVEMTLVLRAAGDPMSVAESLPGVAAELDPRVPVSRVRPMASLMSESLAAPRSTMSLFLVLALLAILLGAVGIYSVTSFAVAERTHEIGVRIALGAHRRDILHLILGQGLRVTACGVVFGIAGAWALTRLLRSVLYEVSPMDAATLGIVVLFLFLIAAIASYFPGRRAMRVDPVQSLRTE